MLADTYERRNIGTLDPTLTNAAVGRASINPQASAALRLITQIALSLVRL